MDGPYYASALTKLKRLLSTVNARLQATDDPFHAVDLFPFAFFCCVARGRNCVTTIARAPEWTATTVGHAQACAVSAVIRLIRLMVEQCGSSCSSPPQTPVS